MRATLLISLTATLFASCGYRVFDNGRRIPRLSITRSADSVLLLNDSLRDIAVIYIKDDDWRDRPVRFRDSAVGKIRIVPYGFRGWRRMTVIFHTSGNLSLGDNSFFVQQGKEYYVILFDEQVNGKHHVECLNLTDKWLFDHYPIR